MPIERPNPVQTWNDILFLYKVYLKVCGNVYLYKMSPSEGLNLWTTFTIVYFA